MIKKQQTAPFKLTISRGLITGMHSNPKLTPKNTKLTTVSAVFDGLSP
jgi:hypothetical protein